MTEHIPLTTTPLPVRLRVEDFFRLDEAGAFEGYGKTELIRGEVFYMNAQHRPHARMKSRLHIELAQAMAGLGSELDVIVEATVAMPPHSAPEPDLVITSEPEGEGPVPLASVRLIVEIADTTQAGDLGDKALLYAENGVPEYWVVDLRKKRLHQMTGPSANGYADRCEFPLGCKLKSITIADLTISLPEGG